MSDEKRMLNVRVNEDTMLALAERANDLDITVSEVVREIIDRGLGIVRTADGFYSPYGNSYRRNVIPTARRELYRWFEYFATNDARLGLTVDLIADLATGFNIKIPNPADTDRWMMFAENLHLELRARSMMREIAVKGEVFVQFSVACPDCGGEKCEHNPSVIKVSILDPETVEVHTGPLDTVATLHLVPTSELQKIVMTGKPEDTYRRIPKEILDAVRRGQAIKLDPRYTVHAKLGPAYERYGTSLIKSILDDLMERQQDPSYDKAKAGVEVFICRLDEMRECVTRILNRALAIQAEAWGVEPATIVWPEGADAEQKWGIALAWKNGDISDRIFAAGIGAKMPEPKTCQICDRSEMVGFTFTVWCQSSAHIATVQQALENKGMNLTWDEVEKHCTQHMVCPKCEACLIPEEGCIKCHECGYSQCR